MKTILHNHKPCPVCRGKVHGRTNKIFCTIKCKNQHHAASRRINKPMAAEVNRRQIRNLVLLEGIMNENGVAMDIHQTELAKHGFYFETVTGFRMVGNRIVYQCYHFSYTLGVDGIVRIKRHEKVNCHLPGFYERWNIEYPESAVKMPKAPSKNKFRSKIERRFNG